MAHERQMNPQLSFDSAPIGKAPTANGVAPRAREISVSGFLLRFMLIVLAWDYFTAEAGRSVAERFYDAASSNQIAQTILAELPAAFASLTAGTY